MPTTYKGISNSLLHKPINYSELFQWLQVEGAISSSTMRASPLDVAV